MRALEYAVRQGLASLWRNRRAGVFAVLAITLALTVLGVLLLVTWNLERVLDRWGSAAELSIYLLDSASSDDRASIERALDTNAEVAGYEYVAKADALVRFREEFAELAPLTESLGGNPFPASLEVRLTGAAGGAEALVGQVAAMPGVGDVRYDRDWIARVSGALGALRAIGLGLGLLLAVAAAVTVASVVGLGLQARGAELEIMALVGAPAAYVRGPFVAEGLLQGGIAALVALVLLAAVYALADAWWGAGLRAVLDGQTLQFLPWQRCLMLLIGGMLVGGIGGMVASRRAGEAAPPALTPAQLAD